MSLQVTVLLSIPSKSRSAPCIIVLMLILFVIVVLGFIEATILGGFDDYWNINDWNSLAKAFPYRDNRNKLLVTT